MEIYKKKLKYFLRLNLRERNSQIYKKLYLLYDQFGKYTYLKQATTFNTRENGVKTLWTPCTLANHFYFLFTFDIQTLTRPFPCELHLPL